MKANTAKMLSIIKRGKTWESVENELKHEFCDGDNMLKIFLNHEMEAANIAPARLFERADMDRSLGYKVLKGERRANRNSLLRIAFVLHLDFGKTQKLLAVGEQPALFPYKRRDAVIVFMLEKKYALEEAHEQLEALGEYGLYND